MKELKNVKGIGPKSELLLNKLGIYTIDDLLTFYPVRYDILKRSDLENALEDEKVIIDGIVDSVPVILRFNAKLNKMNFRLSSKAGSVGISIFNRAFMKSNLKVGTKIIVIGKYDKDKNILTASDIKFGSLNNTIIIEPVYHLTSGLSSKNLHSYINNALTTYGKNIFDYLPDYLKDKYPRFNINKRIALNIVHNPPSEEKLQDMIKRFKYEELFTFMVKIHYLKSIKKKELGIKRNITNEDVKSFYKLLPFTLTNDQNKVIEEIVNDMNSDKIMNRLLQGDVGSGKTIVSTAAMYFNKLSGYQSALMAPTEILATQHYENILKILGNRCRIALLIGSLSKKEKELIYQKLLNNEIDILIGTHAIIQENVKYYNLGLVVTDEQHRFGVNQRLLLKNKGTTPDVLYMSATPIPRTFALTIYGDMDISIIKEKPKGRLNVKTIVKTDQEISEVLNIMYDELMMKHQIYVVTPLIEDDGESDLTSVINLKKELEKAFGKINVKIEMLHGKMANKDKDLIMYQFRNNEINILISTTVVEVGVDVSNASLMIVFDANHFGLSTLHQLRGRVGRGNIESKCILISKEETERLKILEETNDGFKIAEEDFKMRGSGDLFGTRQSGDIYFKIANLKEDFKILEYASVDAKDFLNNSDDKYNEIKKHILQMIDID